MMQFSREINRLLMGMLIAFAVVGGSASYWAIVGADTILLREDNPRLVEEEAAIVRGTIVDRNLIPLVQTVEVPNGLQRVYHYPAMHSALGYSSLRYGVGGAEAAYDRLLRGDERIGTLGDYFGRDMLHLPQQGTHIQLSFDLNIQQQVVDRLEGFTGAAIVLEASSGQVLALVSLPTYDPNTLDTNWETLVTAPGNPFFNRALQSTYQPGGMLYTPLLAGALAANQTTQAVFEAGTAPVALNTLQSPVRCTGTPPSTAITLGDAYVYGCPAPFADMARLLGVDQLRSTFDTFELNSPATMRGFTAPRVALDSTTAVTGTPAPVLLTPDNLLENALGQGSITVTPLSMAQIVTSVVNGGNAPAPVTLLATQLPDSESWSPVTTLSPARPFMTAETALTLTQLMRQSVTVGAAQSALDSSHDMGAQVAIAFAGTGTKAWFAGFVIDADGQALVLVLVLENESDPAAAGRLGGQILAAIADR